ncbi:hypothetical protein WR25_15025 [Diploscapter pachys]|uniref:Choline O-acetyltransferase n=1 Tax=Diploscapter pachys TaxID=2018661 RepID=A0A2A2LKA1_9BILA|nr:hypothetical protein WR25_15025 [Diploscapter pachys]
MPVSNLWQPPERGLLKPPVPPLDATLDRYLEYAAVVAAGQPQMHLHSTIDAVQKFRVQGKPLQEKLLKIAEKDLNWVNSYWLPEMYLRIRIPLPVNSSPAYIFPPLPFEQPDDFYRYTALMTRGFVNYKNRIDRNLIERERATGSKKDMFLCMDQYDRLLGCYRQPGKDQDIQIRKSKAHTENEHVIVMCKKQTFVLMTRINGELLPLADIEEQLKQIEKMAVGRNGMASGVAAGSVGDRDKAAMFWEEMTQVEQNRKSLEWMQKALFVICLDPERDPVEGTKEKKMIEKGIYLLTGNGSAKHGLNRWYDASIQFIVSRDGTSGFCFEHSTAEGIVLVKMVEDAIRFTRENWRRNLMNQQPRKVSAKPLTWHISERAKEIMDEQIEIFDELASEVQLESITFNRFGKERIKQLRVSPDGFFQLAMQLAHYRVHGYLVSTYESCSIRMFATGRVDNIRANTQEALEWVTSMHNQHFTNEQRVALFRKAAEKQAKVTIENITGYGIDNHLCALNVLARESGAPLPEIFTDPLWSELMRFPISTSQVTTSPDMDDCYLTYGAVVRDGYGVPYNLQADSMIAYPATFRSNSRTDLRKFCDALESSLIDMEKLLS